MKSGSEVHLEHWFFINTPLLLRSAVKSYFIVELGSQTNCRKNRQSHGQKRAQMLRDSRVIGVVKNSVPIMASYVVQDEKRVIEGSLHAVKR